MLNEDINVVFITDEDYLLPTTIAVKSLIRNAGSSAVYNIYMIADDACRKKWEEVYSESVDSYGKNVMIRFVEPDTSIGQERFTHAFVSSSALQKFSFPTLFPDLDKILYIDGDILVKGDIAELYNQSFDDHYAAVVKDMPCYYNPVSKARREFYGLKEYFNSGMMLLNLKRLREDGIREKLIEFKEQEENPIFMDQDAFNVIFHEDVKFLSPKFNYLITCEALQNASGISEFYQTDSADITENVVVLHFAGPDKPWNGAADSYSCEWLSWLENIKYYPFVINSTAKRNKKLFEELRKREEEVIRREEELSRQEKELYEMVNILNQFMTQAQGQITSLFEYHNELSTKAKIFQDTNESFNTRITILEEKTGGISMRSVKNAIKKIISTDDQ